MRISTRFWQRLKIWNILSLLIIVIFSLPTQAHQPMVELVKRVKPSIVGIGKFDPLMAPKTTLMATGFAITDGYHIATNAHAVPELEPFTKQSIAVLLPIPSQKKARVMQAQLVAKDEIHDLAILKIKELKVAPLTLSNAKVAEGLEVAFTGFPIGSVLGLNPVTHKGMISSIAPAMLPVPSVGRLTPKQLKALKNPFDAFQLDATAYPGNSGSPVYDVDTGEVIAIINKVLLTGNKESALTNPSAITYAIPVKHLKALLSKTK